MLQQFFRQMNFDGPTRYTTQHQANRYKSLELVVLDLEDVIFSASIESLVYPQRRREEVKVFIIVICDINIENT